MRRLLNRCLPLSTYFQIPYVRVGEGWNTRLVVLGNPDSSSTYRLRLHDCRGGVRASMKTRTIRPCQYERIDCGELLNLKGEGLPNFEGNAVIITGGYEGVIYVELIDPQGRIASTHSLCGGSFRSAWAERFRRGGSIKGTVMYLPVNLSAGEGQYRIALHNLYEANEGRSSNTELRLTRDDGEAIRAEASVPANGTSVMPLEGMFRAATSFLGNKSGLLTVIDNETFLHGIYVRTGRGTICDHLHWG